MSVYLSEAVDAVEAALRPVTGGDWSLPGTGDWTCLATVAHVGDCLLSYAAQIVAQPASRYVNFEAVVGLGATPEEVLEFALAGGRILASVVRTADRSARAFHPTGHADPEGFAAMGCVEMLLHGDDVARRFEQRVVPSDESCQRVLRRLFPEIEVGTDDSWTTLRWATGRTDMPGRAGRADWRWRGSPLDE